MRIGGRAVRGRGEAGRGERRAAPGGRAAPQRVGDARLHARPAGDRQGRPGRAARVLRPHAGPAAAGAGVAARRLRGRARAAERGAEARRPGRDRALDGAARRRSARRWSRHARECSALLAAPFAESAGALGLSDARLAYEGDPPTVEALEARLDRDLERGATGLGPAPARRLDRRPPAATCARSARRASSGRPCSRSCSPRRRCSTERRDEPPLLLLDDVLSELDPTDAACCVEQVAGPRPDADHRDDGGRAARASRRSSCTCRRRRGGEVTWSAYDGEITRGALALRPAGRDARAARRLAGGGRADGRRERLAGPDRARRDAAREHVVVRLGVRARPARARRSSSSSSEQLGESAPKALRFAVGHLPEPATGRAGRGADARFPSRPRKPCNGRPSSRPGSRTKSCENGCERAVALGLSTAPSDLRF